MIRIPSPNISSLSHCMLDHQPSFSRAAQQRFGNILSNYWEYQLADQPDEVIERMARKIAILRMIDARTRHRADTRLKGS